MRFGFCCRGPNDVRAGLAEMGVRQKEIRLAVYQGLTCAGVRSASATFGSI